MCTYSEVDKNNKLTKILDHDNDTFFGSFYLYLQAQPAVESILKVEEAQVPLIKMKIIGAEIDLLLCSKKSFASNLTDASDTSSKKSFNSIQGLECTLNLEKIALSLPTQHGL